MQTRQLQIQFHTPAFLGDATQSGRWRTPPFKAQLRQWWRVAYAAQEQFAVNVREMRDIEGRLFGHAWLENDSFERDGKRVATAARKSEVRLRLNHWSEGQLKSWDRLETGTVFHPEAEKVRHQVGPHAYLGYGPLDGRGGTKLQDKQGKANAAIQAKEEAQLAIAFPDEHAITLDQALQLMNLYGTVGGRSRNGWGSYSLHRTDGQTMPNIETPGQALAKCLSVDWPHALGTDSQGTLIWQTQPHKDWAGLMKTLAQIKIALRTQFVFKTGKTQNPEDRHWLSYPVTNHPVTSWGNNARLPNSLRFKVRPTTDGQLDGVVFHMPHKPPAEFGSCTQTLERIWHQVHSHLDQTATLKRITA
ncbi:MAG: RAMP superfamily CRISPR-associated protein [Polaromonas sp.]|jgi:CRISPR-associated protein Cmr1